MEKNLKNNEALLKLKKLAEDVRICMMATGSNDSNTFGRPMSTITVDDDGTLWFMTKASTAAATDARKDDSICLYYSHPGNNTYLTIKGTVAVVADKAKIKELWNPIMKAWFPDGVDEPGIVALKVTPEEAYYWDTDAATLVILFSMIKAAVTGTPGETGDHGALNIR